MERAAAAPNALDPATDEGKEQLRRDWDRFLAANEEIRGQWDELAGRIEAVWDENTPF